MSEERPPPGEGAASGEAVRGDAGSRATLRPGAAWGPRLRLVRWLGPWADERRTPASVTMEVVSCAPTAPGTRVFPTRVYRPRRPRGAVLVLPGLHYAGPSDPRLDRFNRVLAGAGALVLSPALPDFCSLRLAPTLLSDAERALDLLLGLPERPPGPVGVFSVSFGSLPAFHLAASRAPDVRRVAVFGGFAEWDAAMRFALTGGDGVSHDPLNRPVVFLNLLDHLPDRPADTAPVVQAWRTFVQETWGRPEMKEDGRWQPVAQALAVGLAAPQARLFRLGCGLEAGGLEVAEAAIAASAGARDWLDPRPRFADIHAPVHLVHGADDDVIPLSQVDRLAEAFSAGAPVETAVTGLYGHTGQAGGRGLGTLLREGRSMLRIVDVLAGLVES